MRETDVNQGQSEGTQTPLSAEEEEDTSFRPRIFDTSTSVDSLNASDLEDVFTPHYSDSDCVYGEDIRGTFEFGDSGFTAVLSTDFDLLQLTAPCPGGCGIVFARGNFPDSPRSFLARAQRQGFGFGLRLPQDDVEYRWAEQLPQKRKRDKPPVRVRVMSGYLNQRWPITKEELRNEEGGAIAQIVTCWYMHDGTFVQVTKISAVTRCEGIRAALRTANRGGEKIPYKMGDRIRLGCCCTGCLGPTDTTPPLLREYPHKSVVSRDKRLLTVEDSDLGTRLFMQHFQDGVPMSFDCEEHVERGGVDVAYCGSVSVTKQPVIMVNTCSLRGPSDREEVWLRSAPPILEIEHILGLSSSSMKWGLVWKADKSGPAMGSLDGNYSEDEANRQLKLNMIARTVEHLLTVAIVPIGQTDVEWIPTVGLISNIVSSLKVDVQTCFWQVRTLVRVYNYLQPLCASNELGPVCSAYCLRIEQVLRGVIGWIYSSIEETVADGRHGQSVHFGQRWYYVTGKPGILQNGCKRGSDQLQHLKSFSDLVLLDHASGDVRAVEDLAGYTHCILWWSTTLCYTYQNTRIDSLAMFITLQSRLNWVLWDITREYWPSRKRGDTTSSLLHTFLKWFNSLFFKLVLLNHGTKLEKHEESVREELNLRWETEKIRRLHKDRRPDLYTNADEMNDRMALLMGEIDYYPAAGMARRLFKDVEIVTMRGRKVTAAIRAPKAINLHVSTQFVSTRIRDQRSASGEDAHWSPWEFMSTNYFITMQWASISLKRSRDKNYFASLIEDVFNIGCRQFLQRSYSLVTSWDDTQPCNVADWWCTEPEALLAVTLLDVLHVTTQDMKRVVDAAPLSPTGHGSTLEIPVPRGPPPGPPPIPVPRGPPPGPPPVPVSMVRPRRMNKYDYKRYSSYLAERITGDIAILLYETLRHEANRFMEAQKRIFNTMVLVELGWTVPVYHSPVEVEYQPQVNKPEIQLAPPPPSPDTASSYSVGDDSEGGSRWPIIPRKYISVQALQLSGFPYHLTSEEVVVHGPLSAQEVRALIELSTRFHKSKLSGEGSVTSSDIQAKEMDATPSPTFETVGDTAIETANADGEGDAFDGREGYLSMNSPHPQEDEEVLRAVNDNSAEVATEGDAAPSPQQASKRALGDSSPERIPLPPSPAPSERISLPPSPEFSPRSATPVGDRVSSPNSANQGHRTGTSRLSNSDGDKLTFPKLCKLLCVGKKVEFFEKGRSGVLCLVWDGSVLSVPPDFNFELTSSSESPYSESARYSKSVDVGNGADSDEYFPSTAPEKTDEGDNLSNGNSSYFLRKVSRNPTMTFRPGMSTASPSETSVDHEARSVSPEYIITPPTIMPTVENFPSNDSRTREKPDSNTVRWRQFRSVVQPEDEENYWKEVVIERLTDEDYASTLSERAITPTLGTPEPDVDEPRTRADERQARASYSQSYSRQASERLDPNASSAFSRSGHNRATRQTAMPRSPYDFYPNFDDARSEAAYDFPPGFGRSQSRSHSRSVFMDDSQSLYATPSANTDSVFGEPRSYYAAPSPATRFAARRSPGDASIYAGYSDSMRSEYELISEGRNSLANNDIKNLFRACSSIYHPDYMITSIEDTPDLFDSDLTERMVAVCELEHIMEFLHVHGIMKEFTFASFAIWNRGTVDEWLQKTNFTILDFDSQYQSSIYKKSLHRRIKARHVFDNRVDADAKYRIIAVDLYTPDIVRLQLYLLHSDVFPALDDYFSGRSRFSDSDRRPETPHSSLWFTSLTLAFHELLEEHSEENDFEPHRKNGVFPPENELIAGGIKPHSNKKPLLVSNSITFAISGCNCGRSWTCSVMGRRISKYVVAPPGGNSEAALLEELHWILPNFAHDPRSCRCLVALALTGYMLFEISQAHNRVLVHLDKALSITDKGVIFEGVTFDEYRFENIFAFRWAIDCLERFEADIQDALTKAEEMRRKMNLHMQETCICWSPELRQIFRDVIEVQYIRRRAMLENSLDMVRRRIQKTTAYRDGLSSFMSLAEAREASRQSAAALKQGKNIQILTLITITYLPLSLATSIFGMNILPQALDFRAFGLVLGIALGLTLLGVYNLGTLADLLGATWDRAKAFTAKRFDGAKQAKRGVQSRGDTKNGQTLGNLDLPSTPLNTQEKPEDEQGESDWKYTAMLIRYIMFTLPLEEVLAAFRIRRAVYALAKGTARLPSHVVRGHHKDVFCPQPSIQSQDTTYSEQACQTRWEDHRDSCHRCSRSAPTMGTRVPSLASAPICSVGSKFLQDFMLAREQSLLGPQNANAAVGTSNQQHDPPAPASHSPGDEEPSTKSPSPRTSFAPESSSPTSSFSFSSFSSSSSIVSRRKHDNYGLQLPLSRSPPVTAPRWWTWPSHFLLSLLRIVLLPLWLVVLVVDYILVLIAINCMRLFVPPPERDFTLGNRRNPRRLWRGLGSVKRWVWDEPVGFMAKGVVSDSD